jgi:hypothetical protein
MFRLVDCAMMTLDREGQYIHQTLSSMDPHFRLTLFPGSPSSAYLEPYRTNRWIRVVETTPEDWTLLEPMGPNQRAAWNYWRCLTIGDSFHNGLLVFEDDVQFARGWRGRLFRTLHVIEADYGPNFVLALYACYSFVREAFQEGKLYHPYPAAAFYGTQAMYFTENLRRLFAEYLKAHGVDEYRMPHDLLLQAFLQETGYPLFATAPCLVQHIGKTTTGLGFFHQTDGFVEAVE